MARCKIFDNGGESLDRYTIVDMASLELGSCQAIAADEKGIAFYQHIQVDRFWIFDNSDTEVSLNCLHPQLQKRLIEEFGEEAFQ